MTECEKCEKYNGTCKAKNCKKNDYLVKIVKARRILHPNFCNEIILTKKGDAIIDHWQTHEPNHITHLSFNTHNELVEIESAGGAGAVTIRTIVINGKLVK